MLLGMLELALYRLSAALSTWPSTGEWLGTFTLLAVFAALTLSVVRRSKLFTSQPGRLPARHAAALVLIAVITPSLPEELLYRVLLQPHPQESAEAAASWGWALLSLCLFVSAHPLIAWGVWPWARTIFYRPAFLTVVTLLGVTCTLAYKWSGSVWAPVFIHWCTIVAWKVFFGGPDFNLGKSTTQ